ncbi:hypothetical protein ABFS82_04G196600 [Erythranthe guttata]
MQRMGRTRVFAIVFVLLMMGSCMAKARRIVADETQHKGLKAEGTKNGDGNNGVVVNDDDDEDDGNNLNGENHHAYSIPDFNRQGGTSPGRD